MLQLINLPYDDEMISSYGGIKGIQNLLNETSCNSIEWIWGGRKVNTKLPPSLSQGYHLTFYSDWLDFYIGNKTKLIKKFGNLKTVEEIYGSTDKKILIENYKKDLNRAIALGSKYVVFHVSDVSIEEGYSYKFEHTDKEVIDASIEIINSILKDTKIEQDFLVENLWWAGFRFTDSQITKYLIENINYKNKGIMLDTGHLLNTNTSIKTEEEGIEYINNILESQKEFLPFIKGIHLNKSLSGEYVKNILKQNISLKGDNYFEKFKNSYSHILKIDEHRPFENEKICNIIKKINPKYIVHELSGSNLENRKKSIKIQRNTIWNISTK